MVIFINKDKEIVRNIGTNSAFPCGNIPNIKAKKGEEIIRIHDKSDLAKKIMSANYKFKFTDDLKDIIDIEKKKDKDKKEEKKERQKKKAELNKLGYELLEELPHLIAKFYPTIKAIMKTANIKLTKEQDELIKKYVELKKNIDK